MPPHPDRVAGPRRRQFEDSSRGADSRGLFWALLCGATLLLVIATSCVQISDEEHASELIAAGIIATTDIDQLVDEEYADLQTIARQSDQPTYQVPGFPGEVFLAREEILQLSKEQLRQVLLARTTALVYADGLSAFDTTGSQSISRFSVQGAARTVLGWITGDNHGRAVIASWILLALVVIGGVGVLASGQGYTRFRSFGVALVVAAIPGLLMTFAAVWFIGRSGSDPYTEDLRTILEAIAAVFRRNFIVVAVFGGLIAVSGQLLDVASRRIRARVDSEDEFMVGGPAPHE